MKVKLEKVPHLVDNKCRSKTKNGLTDVFLLFFLLVSFNCFYAKKINDMFNKTKPQKSHNRRVL